MTVHRRSSQSGVSLLGLIFWAIMIAFAAVVILRVLPTVSEYQSVQKTVERLAKNGGSTVEEIRNAFDRTKTTEYSLTSISGKDLEISKRNDHVVIQFAYDKEIELFGPVSILIKYRGSSEK